MGRRWRNVHCSPTLRKFQSAFKLRCEPGRIEMIGRLPAKYPQNSASDSRAQRWKLFLGKNILAKHRNCGNWFSLSEKKAEIRHGLKPEKLIAAHAGKSDPGAERHLPGVRKYQHRIGIKRRFGQK